MSNKQPGLLSRIFTFAWDLVNFSRRFLINLIFIVLVIVFFNAILSDEDRIKIKDSSALVLNFKGSVVEQLSYRDPTSVYLNEQLNGQSDEAEILLSDAILAIKEATTDPRIKLIVLNLSHLRGGGLNKLKKIGEALESFKEAGKKVYAFGDYYSQNQYFLASYADEIGLNPLGVVSIEGYHYYQMYYKEALDKLKVSHHVFKVGQYKSAVEPYTRTDMSEQAKEANQQWLDEIWYQYKNEVAGRRNMDVSNFDENLSIYLNKLKQTGGDFAEFALKNGWIDELTTREDIRVKLIEHVGKDSNNNFNSVSYKDYLKAVKPAFKIDNPMSDKIAIVVARGVISDGHKKAGSTGGDSTAKLLRKARMDKSVKAVVLRVDSPGGSAFASEIIRQEVDLLKAQGKPIIASMSSVAASGGYWISASADQIWASPTTITGSIGIYGMFMTFENSLKTLGVSTDGVSTTERSGISIVRPLNPILGDVIQLNIEKGYQRFLELVASNRNMTLEQANKVAQGRVWTGKKALQLGLVDSLGDLDDAIKAAADLANVEVYDTKVIKQELSTKDKFYNELFNSEQDAQMNDSNSMFKRIYSDLTEQINVVEQFNDPQHTYIHCTHCPVL